MFTLNHSFFLVLVSLYSTLFLVLATSSLCITHGTLVPDLVMKFSGSALRSQPTNLDNCFLTTELSCKAMANTTPAAAATDVSEPVGTEIFHGQTRDRRRGHM